MRFQTDRKERTHAHVHAQTHIPSSLNGHGRNIKLTLSFSPSVGTTGRKERGAAGAVGKQIQDCRGSHPASLSLGQSVKPGQACGWLAGQTGPSVASQRY